MKKAIKKIDAGSADRLQKILGTFDENANLIMHELGVLIRVEGAAVIIEGAEEKVLQAESVVESLLILAENGETVDKGNPHPLRLLLLP